MDSGGFTQIIYLDGSHHQNEGYQDIYFYDEQRESGGFQVLYAVIIILVAFAVTYILKRVKR
ncbi:MAG: hypothetical protein FWC69_03735 [Defluviitaleaceae bacterium]|nr:hypothetical protein [Defluviitaleaceae bacterium]